MIHVIGDVMLDETRYYQQIGTTPESLHCPKVKYVRTSLRVGGAGHCYHQLYAMGVDSKLWTVIGNDRSGGMLGNMLREFGTDHLKAETAGRGTRKQRHIIDDRLAFRCDEDAFHAGGPIADLLEVRLKAEEQECATLKYITSHAFDHAIISDYDKGVCSESVCQQVIKMSEFTAVDPYLCDWSKYRGADVIMPNWAELAHAMDTEPRHLKMEDVKGFFENQIVEGLDIQTMLLKRSEKGAVLFRAGHDEPSEHPAMNRNLIDPIGAGDIVAAVFVACVARDGVEFMQEAMLETMAAAGRSVEKRGTEVVYPKEYLKGDMVYDLTKSQKLAMETINQWRGNRYQIIFVNGCFDGLHPGHIALLNSAAGDYGKVVVALNSDEYIKERKGKLLFPLEERMAMVSAIRGVDLVVAFEDENNLHDLIDAIEPEVMWKGANYERDDGITGAEFCKAIKYVPLTEHSSSKIKEQIDEG